MLGQTRGVGEEEEGGEKVETSVERVDDREMKKGLDGELFEVGGLFSIYNEGGWRWASSAPKLSGLCD